MILKKWLKMLKLYGMNVFCPLTAPYPLPIPIKEFVLYTWLNVENYGQPYSYLGQP